MAVIMRDAIKPNLMQTLENTPVLVHAGPFGNIAHGNSSVVADLIGIHAGDYLDHRGRLRRRHGRRAVLQHQVPGVGAHAGRRRRGRHGARAQGALRQVQDRGRQAAARGAAGREPGRGRTPAGPTCASRSRTSGCTASRRWWRSTRSPSDHPSEHAAIREIAAELGARVAVCTHFADGGPGRVELAEAVAEAAEEPSDFRFLYPDEAPLREKIETIATKVYGADGVDYTPAAATQLDDLRAQRLRRPAGLHRQDAPVDLVRPDAQGRADRLAAAGARGARLGRRRVHLPDLRRHAHHARPGRQARRAPASTSTTTEMSWVSSSLSP